MSRSRVGKPKFTRRELYEPEMLSRIVHKVGHEIGNPLTSVISLATVIERGTAEQNLIESDKLLSYAQSIAREAWRVTAITEKMVYLLSDREGTQGKCDLDKTIRKVLSKLRLRPEFQNVPVELELSTREAHLDDDLLAWVLTALLENAFLAQISEPEASPVSITSETADGRVRLGVRNSRSRPLDVDPSALFDPFQLENPNEKRLGLGLTVAAAIVERMGGQIELRESTTPEGVEIVSEISFSARVPAGPTRTDTQPMKAVERWQNRIAALKGPLQVFVVDDDSGVASAMEKILHFAFATRKDFSAKILRGPEFMELLTQEVPSGAILCDLNLGEVSGRHIFESLSRRLGVQPRNFAFITGDLARHEAAVYLASCGCPHLAKPFEPESLIELTVQLLEKGSC